MTETPEPSDQPESTEQPETGGPTETSQKAATRRARARLALRVSMVFVALAVVAFTYFTPVWMDRGLTKVNEDRLLSIAADTARMISENGWGVDQGKEYAQGQTKLGELDTDVDIKIDGAGITVRITGTAASANPFASLTGADPVNRIEVTYTHQK